MELHRPRAGRRRAAGRRRIRAAGRTLRPRDQHRRAHRDAPRLRAALPDAVPRALHRRGARAGDRRGAAVRARAAGIALRARHRVVGGRGRADAADAGDRALGREADGAHRLPAGADRRRRHQHAVRRVSTSSTGWSAWSACRRSRPPRTMPVRIARRRGAPALRSRARSGSRRSRSTKPATT